MPFLCHIMRFNISPFPPINSFTPSFYDASLLSYSRFIPYLCPAFLGKAQSVQFVTGLNFITLMQKSDCIIGVEHVSKRFGDKAVLNDVNLFVRKGEFVTILGPSGCGKTTLLRLIAGFQTASEGIITIGGRDITQTPPDERPVNTVFQKYALFPHLNVYNNIAFGLKLKKMPEATIGKKVKQALRMVGMTDYEDRDVDSLSGGQQQRVAIARAIVNEPEVLLLDEPLAALDLKMRKDMQMELKEMHQKLGTLSTTSPTTRKKPSP